MNTDETKTNETTEATIEATKTTTAKSAAEPTAMEIEQYAETYFRTYRYDRQSALDYMTHLRRLAGKAVALRVLQLAQEKALRLMKIQMCNSF